MTSAANIEWICPMCGAVFGVTTTHVLLHPEEGSPAEQLLHHAQRDHDLEEEEAVEFLTSANQRTPKGAPDEHHP
jgi:hypothetical protein